MIEKYITVLTSIFVFHVLFTACYLFAGKKFKKLIHDNHFFPTRFFRYKEHNWKLFWLSLLWLLVYYQEPIITWCKQWLR
jgi:hypothetical protein